MGVRSLRATPASVQNHGACEPLYVTLQLTVKVSGNLPVQRYQGLESHTVQLKSIIDAWVQEYATQRTVPAQFHLYQQPAAGSELALLLYMTS